MDDTARAALTSILASQGASLAQDRGRLGAFLRDEAPAAKREINVLLDAIDEHIPDDLAALGADEPIDAAIARLAQRLAAHRGTAPEAAAWAVESWAIALGKTATSGRRITPLLDDAPRPPPAPPPPPGPSLVERVITFFKRPDGKPHWIKIGAAALVVAALSGAFRSDTSPRITRVELGGVTFNGARDTKARIVGDGRRYSANIFFEDADGDVVSLEIVNLTGTWTSGNRTNVRQLQIGGMRAGNIGSQTFSYSGNGAAQIELVLVDAKGQRSKPFPIQYESEAPTTPRR